MSLRHTAFFHTGESKKESKDGKIPNQPIPTPKLPVSCESGLKPKDMILWTKTIAKETLCLPSEAKWGELKTTLHSAELLYSNSRGFQILNVISGKIKAADARHIISPTVLFSEAIEGRNKLGYTVPSHLDIRDAHNTIELDPGYFYVGTKGCIVWSYKMCNVVYSASPALPVTRINKLINLNGLLGSSFGDRLLLAAISERNEAHLLRETDYLGVIPGGPVRSIACSPFRYSKSGKEYLCRIDVKNNLTVWENLSEEKIQLNKLFELQDVQAAVITEDNRLFFITKNKLDVIHLDCLLRDTLLVFREGQPPTQLILMKRAWGNLQHTLVVVWNDELQVLRLTDMQTIKARKMLRSNLTNFSLDVCGILEQYIDERCSDAEESQMTLKMI